MDASNAAGPQSRQQLTSELLRRGTVIPACPLALDASRRWDERRQRALLRYYHAAGAGGLALGVHTTQFAIRHPQYGLYRPLLELTREEMDRTDAHRAIPWLRVGGICGATRQAVQEADMLRELGYHSGLLSLAAMKGAPVGALLDHCREVAGIIPLFGFYLQPAVGGILLPYEFWRGFAEIPNAVAVKIAPFNRYQTLDVVRAVVDAERDDLALYTGNDDHILLDLLTPFQFRRGDHWVERRIVGGLLGQWAVWTQAAVRLLETCHQIVEARSSIPRTMLAMAEHLTQANAAIFDAEHNFAGCVPGIHEVLRRQGLLAGAWCLDPAEGLSPGQAQNIERIALAYPHLTDDPFVRAHLEEWLRD